MENHIAGDKSVLDLLKEDYQSIVEITDVYIPIVGWEKTGLAIKYRLPDGGAELDTIARKVFNEVEKKFKFKRGLLLSIDTMICLNEGLFVKPRGVEDYVQLDPQETGSALTLADGEELSAIFGWGEGEIRGARDVVRKLFAGQELSIIAHSEKLNRWLTNTKTDLTVELWELGEAD